MKEVRHEICKRKEMKEGMKDDPNRRKGMHKVSEGGRRNARERRVGIRVEVMLGTKSYRFVN